MKQHLYIPSLILVLIVSLVYLNDHAGKLTGRDSDKPCLQSEQFASDNGSMENATGEYLCACLARSGIITQSDRTPGQKERSLSVSPPCIILANPLLFDLPPPAPQS